MIAWRVDSVQHFNYDGSLRYRQWFPFAITWRRFGYHEVVAWRVHRDGRETGYSLVVRRVQP
jgi:hypothetical protein